jgi:hypothetical protein
MKTRVERDRGGTRKAKGEDTTSGLEDARKHLGITKGENGKKKE